MGSTDTLLRLTVKVTEPRISDPLFSPAHLVAFRILYERFSGKITKIGYYNKKTFYIFPLKSKVVAGPIKIRKKKHAR